MTEAAALQIPRTIGSSSPAHSARLRRRFAPPRFRSASG
jgi:hypothetical protein